MSFKLWILLLGLILVNAKEIIVDLTENKLALNSIELKLGDKLRVRLDENPTTGYVWQ